MVKLPLSVGNPAIGEMYQGITDILEDGVYEEMEKDYSFHGIFKLMKGSDCSPKSLPIHGKTNQENPPIVRGNCLTQEEAQTVYDCLEADQVVSPIHFNKEIARTPDLRKLAYQKLEEILEEEGVSETLTKL